MCDGGSLSCEKKSWGLSEGDESFEGGTSEKSGSRLKWPNDRHVRPGKTMQRYKKKKEKKRKGSFTGALPSPSAILLTGMTNGPTTHHYPWPSSRHQMGRELSLSRQEREKASQKSTERELAASSLRTFSLHLALSKKKKNRLIQCVHKPLRDGREEGERQDKESDMQTWIRRLVFSSSLHMFTQTFTARLKRRKHQKKKKREKKRRRSAVGCDGVGALWSEIKQTAPLQRTSAHLCDVKSKLINKGLSLSRGPCHPIQGVEASHFHQRRSPTWVNSHLATTQLSLFWCRSHSKEKVSLAPGGHFIAVTNHLSKYSRWFARNWDSCGRIASRCPFRERERERRELRGLNEPDDDDDDDVCFGDNWRTWGRCSEKARDRNMK